MFSVKYWLGSFSGVYEYSLEYFRAVMVKPFCLVTLNIENGLKMKRQRISPRVRSWSTEFWFFLISSNRLVISSEIWDIQVSKTFKHNLDLIEKKSSKSFDQSRIFLSVHALPNNQNWRPRRRNFRILPW